MPYHHFATTTVFRFFRNDHVTFLRDQVTQMLFGFDIVYEALLATETLHRASLLTSQKETSFRVLGFQAYGNTLRILSKKLQQNTVADILAVLVVLMLLAYFEVSFFCSNLAKTPIHPSTIVHDGQPQIRISPPLGSNLASPKF